MTTLSVAEICAGYVTETKGLSRTDKLRLLGNGVVPQQAAHALATLLNERTPE